MRDTTDLLVQQSCCEAEKPDGMFERVSDAIMAAPVQGLSISQSVRRISITKDGVSINVNKYSKLFSTQKYHR